MSTHTPAPAAEPTPMLRVVNPDATAEEIAAIVAVFASMNTAPAPQPNRSLWSAPENQMHRMLAPGAGAWRAQLR